MKRPNVWDHVPDQETLRELTDEVWDHYWSWDARAARSLGNEAGCPLCWHDPGSHRDETHAVPGCRICGDAAIFGEQRKKCPMTPDMIAAAYIDHGERKGFVGTPQPDPKRTGAFA